VSQIGFCCAYLLFIGANLHSYWSFVDTKVALLLMLPCLYLLTLYRQLHRLAWFRSGHLV
jgi:hypothetical protein